MSTVWLAALVSCAVLAGVAVVVVGVEWRIRAGENRVTGKRELAGNGRPDDRMERDIPMERDIACDLLSEMLDSLLAATDYQSGLIHRILKGDTEDIDIDAAMAHSAKTMQDVRRVAHHIHAICGDDRKRAEACRNLRGGATDLRTVDALRKARNLYPDDENVAESLRAVERRLS